METGPEPRAPFWGFLLGRVSWTEQISKTHMSDNITPCEACHFSGTWQRRGWEHEHTHKKIRGRGFTDGRSGRWRDSSEIQLSGFVCSHTYKHIACVQNVQLFVCLRPSQQRGRHSSTELTPSAPSVFDGHTHTHTIYWSYHWRFVSVPDGMLVFPLLFCPHGPSVPGLWAGGSHMSKLNWPNSLTRSVSLPDFCLYVPFLLLTQLKPIMTLRYCFNHKPKGNCISWVKTPDIFVSFGKQ